MASRLNWQRWFRHLICVLALMWTGLLNGQPFFYPSDSTNYVRAADVAIYLGSGKKFATVWTDRHKAEINGGQQATARPASVNNLSSGLIMSGRSPYIGALMYAGYVTSNFWAFVVLQALVAYGLISLGLRQAGVHSTKAVLGVTLALAATTALPTYNSLLLADAFSAFGILAFVLLASPGQLSRFETFFLYAVLAVFSVSHLMHIWMMVGMIAALALLRALRWSDPAPRRAWVAGLASIALGILSIQLTSLVVEKTFGKEPHLLPLLSARFIADGPGKAFIDAGCDERRFQICRIPIGEPRSNPLILFGMTPENGAYMLASPEEKRRLGEEDASFALAVLTFDPLGQTAAVIRNSVRQLLWIDYGGLNQGCWDEPGCWETLPEPIRAKLRKTPSGANAWPESVMNALLYGVVILSLVTIPIAYKRIQTLCPAMTPTVRMWIVVGFAAMLVSCILGGAVAEPQYRYQGRLVWLVPFLAAVCTLLWSNLQPKKEGDSLRAPDGHSDIRIPVNRRRSAFESFTPKSDIRVMTRVARTSDELRRLRRSGLQPYLACNASLLRSAERDCFAVISLRDHFAPETPARVGSHSVCLPPKADIPR